MSPVENESTPLKARRRWPRFRLRTLFILLTLACIWLGWQGKLARNQKAAVAAIRAAGGEINYSHQRDAKGNIDPSRRPLAPDWLRNLIGDDLFVTVEQVFLPDRKNSTPALADGVVARLASLPRLRRLYISSEVSDNGLKTIGTMTQLERLSISSWAITDAGCAHLSKLSRLKGLELLGLQLTDKTIAALSELPRLESLQLRGEQMTNEGLAHLRRLPALRGLTLYGNTMTVPGTQIDGGGLRNIAELKHLENLSLRNVNASDEEVEQLARLTKLKSASFFMTRVTEAGMAQLQQTMPQVVLMAGGGGKMFWPRAVSDGKNTVSAPFTLSPSVVMPGAAGY
jgi:hypothetical protein